MVKNSDLINALGKRTKAEIDKIKNEIDELLKKEIENEKSIKKIMDFLNID